MSPCIRLQDVTFGYRPHEPVLDRVTFDLEPGVFLSVIGPNGAGKTTLISLLAGLLKPLAGRIEVDGRDIAAYATAPLARKIAVVRQEYAPVFGFSVVETVLMARTPFFGQFGFETAQDREMASHAMELTDTARLAERPLSELSGGERQRVFIARALAQDTPIVLLDEPTSFLDLRHQLRIYDLLRSVQRDKNRTIVSVTHDINLASQYCDQVLLLEAPRSGGESSTPRQRHRIGPPKEILTDTSIERAFGVRIVSASVDDKKFFIPRARDAQ
jgi:iron complex transport system ATP-binding protein